MGGICFGWFGHDSAWDQKLLLCVRHAHVCIYVRMCIPGKRYKVSKLAILKPQWTVGCKDDIAQNKDALHTHMHVYMCGCVYITRKEVQGL